MKYTYCYKTGDGIRHEAAMNAPSREAVFEELRRRGIRAIKVVAADGSKANGEIRGVRKRVVAAIAVGVALVVGIFAFLVGERGGQGSSGACTETAPRHQIYGDPAIVADFERGNLDEAFSGKSDRMLAWFAQPGKLMCPKGVDPRLMGAEFAQALHEQEVSHKATTAPCGSREMSELRQIVSGMRDELAAYLANGNGTPRSYWRRLIERTQQEMQIYERTRRELESECRASVWEEKNESLRRLGLRTIPNQKDAE